MADAAIHASISKIPMPEISSTPFVTPPALSEARVAIVTTAGLTHRHTPKLWTMGDSGYRSFAHADRDLVVAHVSSNFDRAGISADLNVAYPIDRLDELAAAGRIGSVASHHLSFMGALMDLSTLQLDTGPAAAAELQRDGVNLALLTPV